MGQILIVDDAENWAREARYLFLRMGHSVSVQADLEGGLREAKSLRYDLVLLDKNLGTHRGVVPLLDYLLSYSPDTKVILWSGEDMQRARKELPADAYILKDTNVGAFRELEQTVKALLAA